MCCSVVFGVTLRLLVINISSSSPAINTAAYYQWCVITCGTVAVVHRRSCWQHLACCSLNSTQALKADVGSESRFLPTTPAFDAPARRSITMPFGTGKLEWWAYPTVKKIWWYVYSWWQNSQTWHRHTQTDRQTDTAWRHRPRLCIASRGQKLHQVSWTSYIVSKNMRYDLHDTTSPIHNIHLLYKSHCCTYTVVRTLLYVRGFTYSPLLYGSYCYKKTPNTVIRKPLLYLYYWKPRWETL